MTTMSDQVSQLEAAIAAQEGLRATVGDAVVNASIAALRQQIGTLRSERNGAPQAGSDQRQATGIELESRALANLQGLLPAELAAKAQAAPKISGERRQVTLLFADLSGFTAVSERADPEVIRAFQHDLFQELARIIYQYEGFIEKFVGDAVLAIFGAPVAHEDDPERALRVALAIRQRMSVLNRTWTDRLGAVLTLHVGVNTGEVVAGKIGTHPQDAGAAYAVTGDTVNTASRLQDAARPGQVLVSRTTYRLAQAAFSFEAHEPMTVKNKRDPLPVYELLRARSLPGKLRGIPGMAEAFVGRNPDLEVLSSVTNNLTSDTDGQGGRIVFITGEAGIGKSRLVDECRKQTDEKVLWLEGRCFAHTTALSYGPLLDLIRRFAGIVDDDSERRARKRLDTAVERLFPERGEARAIFASLLAMRLTREETARLSKLQARDLREQIFSLVTELLTRLIHDRPVILYLDDMHWADNSTSDLIEHLLGLIPTKALVLMISARPDGTPALSRLREILASDEYRSRTLRIALEPLPESSSLEMIRALLQVPSLPPRLGGLVTRKAEGNPFFVEEIIRTLIERGALVRDDDRWATTELLGRVSETIPDTLQGLIMERIDRLPDETKYVVQHAAVIGRTFLYRVLLEIAEHSPSLDADLSHLERSALIREHTRAPEVEYTFQHALTQDMAYQTLLKTRAGDLHRRVGEAIERIFAGRLGEYYPILAEHFRKGEVWDKAGDYHVKAGDHASQLFAAEAVHHYRAGLDALEHLRATAEVKRRRIDASISLAREVFLGPGGELTIDECTRRLHVVEALADSLVQSSKATVEDRRRMGRVHAWLGHAYARQDAGRMSDYFQKALEAPAESQDAELAAFMGQVFVQQGQFEMAEAILATSVRKLQDTGRWLEWVNAVGTLAVAAAAQKRLSEAIALAEMALARSRNLEGQATTTLVVTANNYLACTLFLAGQIERAAEISRANRVAAAGTKNPMLEAVAATMALYATTHMAGGLDEAKTIREDHKAVHSQPVLFEWRQAVHARIAYLDGDYTTARELAEQAAGMAHERRSLFAEAQARRVLAHVVAAQGSSQAEVFAHLDASKALFAQGGCHVEVDRTDQMWKDLRGKSG